MFAPVYLLVYYLVMIIDHIPFTTEAERWLTFPQVNQVNMYIYLLLRWTEFSKVSSIFMKNVILLRRVMIKYMLSVHIVSRLFLHPGGNCVGVASLTFIVPPHLISSFIPFYTGVDVSIKHVQCMCLCCALPFSLLLQSFRMNNE